MSVASRIDRLESLLAQYNDDDSAELHRVKKACFDALLVGVRFVRVNDPNYYQRSLPERRALVGAISTAHLCKSILVHNDLCVYTSLEDWKQHGSDPKNSPFYSVLIQYTTRLSSGKLTRFLRRLNPEVSSKAFRLSVANEEEAFRLGGFAHNAISPLGMREPIPFVISAEMRALDCPFVWFGGGEVDVKLGVELEALIEALGERAFVADITCGEQHQDGEDLNSL